MDWPARVSLREVGPRDGLQNEAMVPTEAKVRLLDALSGTGVGRIEAVSFVHPSAIPQMADADEVWAAAVKRPGVRYSALVPNSRGTQRALAAGFTEIEVVVSASDTHNYHNVNRSTAASLDDIAGIVAAAHAAGAECEVIVATSFGCPYAPGATGNVASEEVVHMLHDMGIDTGVDLAALIEAARLAQDIVGRQLPSGVLKAGPRLPFRP